MENIIPATTADRCGALGIGDQVLAIDEILLEEWNGSVADAERLLRTATKLQILPYHAVQKQSRHFSGERLQEQYIYFGLIPPRYSLTFMGNTFRECCQ